MKNNKKIPKKCITKRRRKYIGVILSDEHTLNMNTTFETASIKGFLFANHPKLI